jgi:hypothetical protein
MNRPIKSLAAVAMTLLMVVQCNKLPSNPEKKTVQFNFQLQNAANPNLKSAPVFQSARTPTSLQKEFDLQAFDMVRIMVIDLSAYGSWLAFEDSSETGKAYMENRAVWYEHGGDAGNWAAWKKFWQDYATIVVDQTLEIQGQEAVGTIAGVVGYNNFLAGIFQNGRVRYWYTGEGYGKENETHDVTLTFAMEVQPIDPCQLVKSMDKSPEEAVFNAAFGK